MTIRHAQIKDNIVINIVMYEYDETLEQYYTFIPLGENYTVQVNDVYIPETGLFEHRAPIVPETTVMVFE